jgi:ATP/maltotriose-dependent transcriptional regulator MalT
MSRRDIAVRLYVSLNTVKTHQRVSIANSESPTGHGVKRGRELGIL